MLHGQGNSPRQDATVTDSGAANDNGDLFRYSGTRGVDGNWIYNLSTKDAGYVVNNTPERLSRSACVGHGLMKPLMTPSPYSATSSWAS